MKVDGFLQYKEKKYGDFESPDYILTNTGLNSKAYSVQTGLKKFETGFNFYYTYVKNEIGILRSSHIGNIEDLVDAINSDRPFVIEDFSYAINEPKQEVTHQLIKANYYKRFENFGKINLQYDYQNNRRKEFDVRVGDRRNIPAVDLVLQTHTLTLDFDSNLFEKFDLNME